MSGAPDGLGGLSVDSLRRNRFCIGVKRGSEYRCGGDADENAINKAVELLVEAVRRIWRWRVWDSWWVDEWMDEWLEKRDRLETQLRGKYNNEIINDITGLVDKFINYNEDFRRYWHSVGGEVKRLVDDLINGRAEVIIWYNASGVSVYGEYVTLETSKIRKSITVRLVLNGVEGMTIRVPDVFKRTMSEREYKKFVKSVLKALRGGFEETDGFAERGKAAMGTTQIWQVIVWSLLYPGEVYVLTVAVDVNENDVTIKWCLKSSHKSIKGKILSDIGKLSKEEILAFVFTAVLGDGDVIIAKDVKNNHVYDKAMIEITMSNKKFKRWKPLLDKLREMGFRSAKPKTKEGNAVDVPFYGSNAIGLSRAMIAVLPPILRDVLDALAFEKWLKLRRIAEMELKFRIGESQVTVANYGFTVLIHKSSIELDHRVKDRDEAEKVINALRAVYGDEFVARINKSGKRLAVRISMYVFERYEDIKEQVIEVLCKKLERTKDERKRQIIVKHLMRLTTSTEGAAAANHTQPSLPWTQYRCAGAIW